MCRSLQGRSSRYNLDYYAVPVLTELTKNIRFPDMALLYSMWDEPPVRRIEDEPGPWFAYCGKRQELNNLLLPVELSHSKAGALSLLQSMRGCLMIGL